MEVSTYTTINENVQSFVAGLVMGINMALLVGALMNVMDWCSDPLSEKLQNRIRELEEENEKLDNMVTDLTNSEGELRIKLGRIEIERDEQDEEIEDLYDDLDDKRKRIRYLSERVRDLREINRIRTEVESDGDSTESGRKRRRIDHDT